ncbi:alpha/beta hydrolase [Aestuariivivens sediminis]|uniref:alpha/beta hydrolase n=1 Tax=Aestuariivivens sediminis TaxID=2913557 RepID=UPI001F5A0D7E|nr:alpha/beta hydrolase [Aestuariivivens sediminis]
MKIKFWATLLIYALLWGNIEAQDKVIPIWKDSIPGAIPTKNYKEELQIEKGEIHRIKKVVTPTLSVFFPEKPNGTSVIICPGGGYRHLAIHKEGTKVAKWLNSLGITAFVLKYRLPSNEIMVNKCMGPLQDAQRAIRYVRRHAMEWQLHPNRIGVIGFSAGGHLAATLSNRFNDKVYQIQDSISARPDFSILVYPVISMQDPIAHQGSKANLLGESASNDMVGIFSMENQVHALTPPTFLIHASNDTSVPVQNSLTYYEALKKHNVPVELHIYENGGHGFGLGRAGTDQFWTKSLEYWLAYHKWIIK